MARASVLQGCPTDDGAGNQSFCSQNGIGVRDAWRSCLRFGRVWHQASCVCEGDSSRRETIHSINAVGEVDLDTRQEGGEEVLVQHVARGGVQVAGGVAGHEKERQRL